MKRTGLIIVMILIALLAPGPSRAQEQQILIPSLAKAPDFLVEVEAPPDFLAEPDFCQPVPGYWLVLIQIAIAVAAVKSKTQKGKQWQYLLATGLVWPYLIFLFSGCAQLQKVVSWIGLSLLISVMTLAWIYRRKW